MAAEPPRQARREASGPEEPGTPNLYFDRQFNTHAAKILPGEYYATTRDMMIVTVLGSCVSACIRDRESGVGGMNHFMLPHGGDAEFALKFLETENIRVIAKDLLDVHPRKVSYFPNSGRVLVKKLRNLHNSTIIEREQEYKSRLGVKPVTGDVELFS